MERKLRNEAAQKIQVCTCPRQSLLRTCTVTLSLVDVRTGGRARVRLGPHQSMARAKFGRHRVERMKEQKTAATRIQCIHVSPAFLRLPGLVLFTGLRNVPSQRGRLQRRTMMAKQAGGRDLDKSDVRKVRSYTPTHTHSLTRNPEFRAAACRDYLASVVIRLRTDTLTYTSHARYVADDLN